MDDELICNDIVYLIEPSSIMLNRLMKINRNVFKKLIDKKIVLNKSMLDENDIKQFEYEANTKIVYSVLPLDDRKKNDQIRELLSRLGLIKDDELNMKKDRLFGIFKI